MQKTITFLRRKKNAFSPQASRTFSTAIHQMQETPATKFLAQNNVNFTVHEYEYQEKGGTARSSQELNVNEHAVVKTLVFEREDKSGLIVLMHGDRKVDTKGLAKQIGAKKIKSCSPDDATKHTGYLVGGTSPFGIANPLPICLQKSILEIDKIYINGGGRGFLVSLESKELVRVLNPILVDVAKE